MRYQAGILAKSEAPGGKVRLMTSSTTIFFVFICATITVGVLSPIHLRFSVVVTPACPFPSTVCSVRLYLLSVYFRLRRRGASHVRWPPAASRPSSPAGRAGSAPSAIGSAPSVTVCCHLLPDVPAIPAPRRAAHLETRAPPVPGTRGATWSACSRDKTTRTGGCCKGL